MIICEFENIDNPEIKFALCNIYAPNEDKPEIFVDIFKNSVAFSANRIIIGDFNLVLNPTMDRHNSQMNHTQSLNILNSFMEDFGL